MAVGHLGGGSHRIDDHLSLWIKLELAS